MNTALKWTAWVCSGLIVAGGGAQSVRAREGNLEASLHGYPVMRDLSGRRLAGADFVQWVQSGLLHVRIDYDFGKGHRIEENASFQQVPWLVQQEWSWNESRNGRLLRHFEVDFKTGKAIAQKRENNSRLKQWTESIPIQPGTTFAGFGFVLAIKRQRQALATGRKIELHAVGFTPKPRLVSVQLWYGGRDRMSMGGRTVQGDLFIIHPEIPAVARLLVDVKDTHIWLTPPPAVGFLRWEGPLVEADDPVVRVDLLPGGVSGPARPLHSPDPSKR